MLFTGVNIEEALTGQREMLNTALIAGIACGLACIFLIIVFSIFAVSKPLKRIGVFARKISIGDVGASSATIATIGIRSSDEVGVLAKDLEYAYAQLRGYIIEIRERMQVLANGDLSTESTYDFQGDFVLIRNSINEIVRNLNQTMTEINSSSAQVSSGAKQVANGAQLLAQGSTEQAATIEELSSSITRIAENTKTNAATAGKTSELSETIRESAEKGSRQMDEMITAVKEINDASHSISKSIKTIDDIACQTNILALNAAVEAARAGQHGKGFAVVAEEVRNLASKSAEAAKETGDMIQNSMDKAAIGSRIAGETAASLKEIVTGINESNQLVTEIAKSSEEQSQGIAHINIGIDQVTQVVQQNSATAQESAAASEEMNGQSETLQHLIRRFQLKLIK
jgi:methyl-accepting chemotaxis protein